MELLKPFFNELVKIMKEKAPTEAIGLISQHLHSVLISENIKFSFPMGDNIVWEQMGGITLLTHAHTEVTSSPPHDHGSEWVFYGCLEGVTTMMDFYEIPNTQSITDPEWGKLALKAQYTLVPGQWGFYDVEDIHSHYTSEYSKWIRIESRNIHRGDIEGKLWSWDDVVR